MGVKRGGGRGCMFLKKGGISRRGMKKEREGGDTPFCTTVALQFLVPFMVKQF